MKLDSNNVSLAGEFAVLAQLALRGFVANMTLGHAKGIDILVADPNTGRMRKLEVKTSTRPLKHGWMMHQKHERIDDANLFFVFVRVENHHGFKFWVVPSAVVADHVRRSHKHWADSKTSRNRATAMRILRRPNRPVSAGGRGPLRG